MKTDLVKQVMPAVMIMLMTVLVLSSCGAAPQSQTELPNIMIIYADDMGYGDVARQNPDSKIPTPHLDRLAQEGMRFVDAHSSSGICTPSRFALLTGTYHWRRAHDIVNSFGAPYFKEGDVTIPMVLKQKDYVTASIGKWHLGWNWRFNNKPSGETVLWRNPHKYYLPKDVNFTDPITGGPLDRGFDSYFGDGTINFPPYAWIENDRFIDIPTESLDLRDLKTKEGNWEFRPGPMVAGWDPYQVLPTLEKRGVAFIKQQQAGKPFFLYFALPSPHAPIIPNDEFDGKSQAGAYGDFVVQTDQVVGNLLQALRDKNLDQNTLVIFTADNGPEIYAFDRARDFDHHSMGKLRGLKRDVWEGGHRVPFIVKWTGKIKNNTVSNETISQVDIMATLAKVTGCTLPEKAAPDSYDLLPVLLGKSYQQPLREATVQNTFKDKYGIRQGKWMLIETNSGQHSKTPDWYNELKNFPSFDSEPILFDLSADPGQRKNLAKDNPTRVAKMQALLKQYQSQGYSVTRSAQPKGISNLEAGL